MEIEYVRQLQQSHPGIQLLRATLFPLIASFFHNQFIEENQKVWRLDALAEKLDDYIFELNQRENSPELGYSRTGHQYLQDWSDKQGYLTKYYIEEDDEPRIELTASIERTLSWLEGLKGRSFVGTESRLKTIFDMLRAFVHSTEEDANIRLRNLQQRKEVIEEEIASVSRGDITLLDSTQTKEQFQQIEETAKALLGDFSEVEQNFRELDQMTRKRIAHQEGSRGDLLHDIFADADAIRHSDQGKSFTAFWEFLMSLAHQDELDTLLEKVYSNQDILLQEQQDNRFLANLKLNLLEAADKIMSTNRQLADQLRRFLDDRARLDNRRISDLIQNTTQMLLTIAETGELPSDTDWMVLDDIKSNIHTPSRKLYSIPLSIRNEIEAAMADDTVTNADILFDQHHVDIGQLEQRIRYCLESSPTIGLPELLKKYPPKQGISELVVYLKLASEGNRAMVDTKKEERITITTDSGTKFIKLPMIVFTR